LKTAIPHWFIKYKVIESTVAHWLIKHKVIELIAAHWLIKHKVTESIASHQLIIIFIIFSTLVRMFFLVPVINSISIAVITIFLRKSLVYFSRTPWRLYQQDF